MSHWNYRVFRYSDGTLGIHEAYYPPVPANAPDRGIPNACTEEAVRLVANDHDDMRDMLVKIIEALAKPVLDYSMITRRPR